MEHLTPTVLSRLVEEVPTAEERDHLSRCERCASELDALRGQTAGLAELPDVRPPRGDWESLEARLVAEGLVEAATPPTAPGPRPYPARWIRAAASVAIFAAGAAVGVGATARGIAARAEADSIPSTAIRLQPTTDPGAALAQMLDAERTYIDALSHYRHLIGAQGADEVAGDARVRYAALEDLVRAGQAAVSRAPADPFLNGLLASALAEREAVSRRLSGTVAGQDGWF
jgi:hypothetical protein